MEDNLLDNVRAAMAAAMSYGQWKALHPSTAKPRFTPEQMEGLNSGKLRICTYCDELYSKGGLKYCTVECRDAARRKRYMESKLGVL